MSNNRRKFLQKLGATVAAAALPIPVLAAPAASLSAASAANKFIGIPKLTTVYDPEAANVVFAEMIEADLLKRLREGMYGMYLESGFRAQSDSTGTGPFQQAIDIRSQPDMRFS